MNWGARSNWIGFNQIGAQTGSEPRAAQLHLGSQGANQISAPVLMRRRPLGGAAAGPPPWRQCLRARARRVFARPAGGGAQFEYLPARPPTARGPQLMMINSIVRLARSRTRRAQTRAGRKWAGQMVPATCRRLMCHVEWARRSATGARLSPPPSGVRAVLAPLAGGQMDASHQLVGSLSGRAALRLGARSRAHLRPGRSFDK